MSIFVVLPPQQNSVLDAAIKQAFPSDLLQLAPNQWLVSAGGTAQDVATKLGILAEGSPPSAIVIVMSSYHGRAPTPVWDWIKAKLEAKTGA